MRRHRPPLFICLGGRPAGALLRWPAEISIIPQPADFVKCFLYKNCTKFDPEICAIFYVYGLDKYTGVWYIIITEGIGKWMPLKEIAGSGSRKSRGLGDLSKISEL